VVRRVWLAAMAAMAFLGVAAACSTFSSNASSDDAGGPDAGEAAPTDGAAPDGAGADTGPAGDASDAAVDGPYCQRLSPQPVLCADFDEGRPPGEGFGSTVGAPTVDDAFATSPPASMRIENGPGGTTAVTRIFAQEYIAYQRFAFDVLMGEPDGGAAPSNGRILALRGASATASCSVYVDFSPSFVISLAPTGATETSLAWADYPPPSTWSHVEIELELGDAGAVLVSVTVDGKKTIPSTTTTCSSIAGFLALDVGLLGSGAGVVRFDNVVFDGK
jgi:hypothetical protein